MGNIVNGVAKSIVRTVKDIRATYYIKKVRKLNYETKKIIKVAFIVFEPESWDKLQPVYEEMVVRENFEPQLILIPSYDDTLSLEKKYGYEKEFFEKKYGKVLLAYDDNGMLIDLEKYGFDYVFYQDPYNAHYPKGIDSNSVVRYAKVCYIPYGYTISKNFSNLLINNRSFFRNVSIFYAENNSVEEVMKTVFGKNYVNGIQKIECMGYPSFEEYSTWNSEGKISTITWAPRWSYDKSVGGSHFIEYKDKFLLLRKKYESLNLLFRPHPMLFANMVKMGKMTEKEVAAYKKAMNDNQIQVKNKCAINDVLYKTDLLISDISSVIPSFFMTGRPIIYCKSEMEVNIEFQEMLKGIYVAESWDEVEKYISEILAGNDPLKEIRHNIINKGMLSVHLNSKKKIVNFLIDENKSNFIGR